VWDVRGVICRRNFHEVETDVGLFEVPGERRQVNGLEGVKGMLKECLNWRRMCLFERMKRRLGTGRKWGNCETDDIKLEIKIILRKRRGGNKTLLDKLPSF